MATLLGNVKMNGSAGFKQSKAESMEVTPCFWISCTSLAGLIATTWIVLQCITVASDMQVRYHERCVPNYDDALMTNLSLMSTVPASSSPNDGSVDLQRGAIIGSWTGPMAMFQQLNSFSPSTATINQDNSYPVFNSYPSINSYAGICQLHQNEGNCLETASSYGAVFVVKTTAPTGILYGDVGAFGTTFVGFGNFFQCEYRNPDDANCACTAANVMYNNYQAMTTQSARSIDNFLHNEKEFTRLVREKVITGFPTNIPKIPQSCTSDGGTTLYIQSYTISVQTEPCKWYKP